MNVTSPSVVVRGTAQDGAKLRELRRGADTAQIFSLAFSPEADFLALSSDKGTVHVYILDQARAAAAVAAGHLPAPDSAAAAEAAAGETSTQGMDGSKNAQSALSFMKGFLPKYFSSEWSFAQFRLPEDTPKVSQPTLTNTRNSSANLFSLFGPILPMNPSGVIVPGSKFDGGRSFMELGNSLPADSWPVGVGGGLARLSGDCGIRRQAQLAGDCGHQRDVLQVLVRPCQGGGLQAGLVLHVHQRAGSQLLRSTADRQRSASGAGSIPAGRGSCAASAESTDVALHE